MSSVNNPEYILVKSRKNANFKAEMSFNESIYVYSMSSSENKNFKIGGINRNPDSKSLFSSNPTHHKSFDPKLIFKYYDLLGSPVIGKEEHDAQELEFAYFYLKIKEDKKYEMDEITDIFKTIKPGKNKSGTKKTDIVEYGFGNSLNYSHQSSSNLENFEEPFSNVTTSGSSKKTKKNKSKTKAK